MGGFDGGLYQLAFLLVVQGVLVSWSSQDFALGFLIGGFGKCLVVVVAYRDEIGGGRGWSVLDRGLLESPSPWGSVWQSLCFVRACFIARVGILFWESNLAFLVEWVEDLSVERTLVGSISLITLSFFPSSRVCLSSGLFTWLFFGVLVCQVCVAGVGQMGVECGGERVFFFLSLV